MCSGVLQNVGVCVCSGVLLGIDVCVCNGVLLCAGWLCSVRFSFVQGVCVQWGSVGCRVCVCSGVLQDVGCRVCAVGFCRM